MFQLTDEQTALCDRARALSRSLRARAAEIDRTEEYPWDNVGLLKQAGFLGMTMPRALGGQGLGWLEVAIVIEEIAKNCAVSARIVVETNMGLGSVSSGGVLYAEACAALYEGAQRPLVMSFMAGMGGEAIVLKEFYWMTQKMLEAQKRGGIEKRTHWVGFEE